MWQSAEEGGSSRLIGAIGWMALRCPRPLVSLLLAPIAVYFVVVRRAAARNSRTFLAHVARHQPPDAPKFPTGLAGTFEHFRRFAQVVLDRVYFLRDPPATELITSVSGDQALLQFFAQGRGVVLLGAHLGSFEALRASGRKSAEGGLLPGPLPRIRPVMYRANARKVQAFLDAINPRLSADVIELGAPDSLLVAAQAIERGELIGILADRTIEVRRTETVDFLGRPMVLAAGPFVMALALQAPIVFGCALLENGRYRVHFDLLHDGSPIPRAERAQAIRQIMGSYARHIERHVLQHPLNWFNFHEIWAA